MPFRWLPLLLIVPAIAPAADTAVSFRNEVQAVLSRSGCNAGACHGNLNGKGGFKLSLRGEDTDADFAALTRSMLGRRIDTHSPADSLLLKKAIGVVPHEGGTRFSMTSSEYQILSKWITDGCQPDPAKTPTLTSLTPSVKSLALVDPQRSATVSVRATFSDGTTRDVSTVASYELTNVGVAKLTNGVVSREQFGETVLVIRYLNLQVPIRVAFLPDRPPVNLSAQSSTHPVDELVLTDLTRLRIRPSDLCTDGVFIRRAYLDACGTTPTADEVRAFLDDRSSDKRTKLIDTLLARSEFADYWAQKWGDLLRNEEKSLDRKGVSVFHRWIRNWFADDKPLTDFAREILTARGSTYTTPAANFYRAVRDPYQRAESVAQVFLGLRVNCARCHNHPFDFWTQDDYHRFAAVFARIDYRVVDNKRNDDLDKHEFVGEQIVVTKPEGELTLPRGGVAVPKLLGATAQMPTARGDRLGSLADWLTASDNPFFATAQANRIWAHLMGHGVVDPIDDFKLTNPASNPELIDHLSKEFAAGGYRLKPLVRHIMTSQTYQRSATPNDTNADDSTHFSHATVQPLEAEQLLDAVTSATGTVIKWPGYPRGMRAGQLASVPMAGRRMVAGDGLRFLRMFGKPERLLTCECERGDDPGVLQAFQMLTGELVNSLIRQPNNRLGRLLSTSQSDTDVLEALYLATIARRPTEHERTKLLEHVNGAQDKRVAWEDISWGLLNSKEFLLRR